MMLETGPYKIVVFISNLKEKKLLSFVARYYRIGYRSCKNMIIFFAFSWVCFVRFVWFLEQWRYKKSAQLTNAFVLKGYFRKALPESLLYKEESRIMPPKYGARSNNSKLVNVLKGAKVKSGVAMCVALGGRLLEFGFFKKIIVGYRPHFLVLFGLLLLMCNTLLLKVNTLWFQWLRITNPIFFVKS